MLEGRAVALVDDVRERLERPGGLAPKLREARVTLVDREQQGDQDDHVPRVPEREDGDRRAEPCLAGFRRHFRPHVGDEEGHEPRLRGERDDRADEERVEQAVGDPERAQCGQIIG